MLFTFQFSPKLVCEIHETLCCDCIGSCNRWNRWNEIKVFIFHRKQHFMMFLNQMKKLCLAYLHLFNIIFPPQRPRYEPREGHMGFVVDRMALEQVLYEYFSFPCHSFYVLLHIHHHPSSGAGTIGQTVADVPSGLSQPIPKN
jgi:hypothetical protein